MLESLINKVDIRNKIDIQEEGKIMTVNLLDLANMLSVSVDLMEDGVYHHGQRVAYIAYRIFQELYPGEDAFNLVLASFLHDIGIDSDEKKKEARNFIVDEIILSRHTIDGEKLLSKVDLLEDTRSIVKHHHTQFKDIIKLNGEIVPIEAQIIALADRIEVLIDPHQYILDQTVDIISKIKKFSGTMFNPKIVDCFIELAEKEAFWLDIDNEYAHFRLWQKKFGRKSIAYEKDIRQFAILCGDIVDRKSPFTSNHSKRVASISRKLGQTLFMSDKDVFLLEIAGELHDIGKLSIPTSILHKNGGLTAEEYRIIKQHSYYTYYLIDRLNTMDMVRDWAAFHHERLDGSGYPFHLKGNQLDLGSRVMAVADIVTALSEDRPYRNRLEKNQIMKILWDMVKNNKIDGDVVRSLESNYDFIVLDIN